MPWLDPDLLLPPPEPRVGGAQAGRRALLAWEHDGPFALAVRGGHRAEDRDAGVRVHGDVLEEARARRPPARAAGQEGQDPGALRAEGGR